MSRKTRLEYLLERFHAAGTSTNKDDTELYEYYKRELAWWVHRLWCEGRFDAHITLVDGKKHEN